MSIKLLNTGALLFFAVLMAGLLISRFSAGKYRSSNAGVLEISLQDDFIMEYAELVSIRNDTEHNLQFIDLRNAESFSQGHIPGAVNIPLNSIFEREYSKIFGEEGTKVLYSDQEMHAVHAALMLLGKGFRGIRVLPGSFSVIEAHILTERPDPAYLYYRDDKARFDYPRFMQGSATTGPESQKTSRPVIPAISAETVTVQGGC